MDTTTSTKDAKKVFGDWFDTILPADISKNDIKTLKAELLAFAKQKKEEEISAMIGDDIQKQALNGIQIESLLSIINNIVAGILPPESAKLIIMQSFPTFDEGRVDEMVKYIKVNPLLIQNKPIK